MVETGQLPDFRAVGVCIYCGATEYRPDTGEALSREHIIPYGLNGDLELLEASCERCARITGSIVEGKVLRGHLIGSRAAMGLKSRKKNLSKPLSLFVGKDGESRIRVPPQDCPGVLLLPHFPDPALFWAMEGWGMPSYDHPPYLRWFNYRPEMLREKYGVDTFAPPALDTLAFCRMIAKIGHASAVAQLGLHGFVPLLAKHICDENMASRAILPFIGGRPPSDPVPALHTTQIERAEIGGAVFVVALIRLFAQFGAPTFIAIVGLENGQPPVLLPNVSVEEGALHRLYRVFARVD